MRHSFRFPKHIRDAVHNHVTSAIAKIKPTNFRQEPNYTAALAGALIGNAYSDKDGMVKFEATVVDDRSTNSAESWSGADWVITAEISDSNLSIRKAIMIQTKLGLVENLNKSRRKALQEQIEKMRKLTKSPKVMEVLELDGRREPRIVSGNRVLANQPYRSYSLEGYITGRVLTTFDGDTRPEFVDAVQDSKLSQLNILAFTRG
jgi:hypothetical protein